MKTLTEMTEVETKAREIAYRFERLRDQAQGMRNEVTRLETRINAADAVPEVLSQIAVLVERIPPSYQAAFAQLGSSRVEQHVADVQDLADHFRSLLVGASRFNSPKISRWREQLVGAKQRLATVEAAIRAVEAEFAQHEAATGAQQ